MSGEPTWHAVILGGAGGVGSATARILLSQGFAVTVVDKAPPPTALAARAAWVECDLSSARGLRDATRRLSRGRTALVLAAGTVNRESPGQITAVNYLGTRNFVDEMRPKMSQGSVVVGLSSVSASRLSVDRQDLERVLDAPGESGAPYVSWAAKLTAWEEYRVSKWLLEEWLLRVAAQTFPSQMRVNVVSPGSIRTPLLDKIYATEASRILERGKSVMGRVAESEDIAAVVGFLVSAQAEWVHGSVITVDGGLMNALHRGVRPRA